MHPTPLVDVTPLATTLLCPNCGGDLDDGLGGLGCVRCGEFYPFRDGIPIMMRDAALRKELLEVDVSAPIDAPPSLATKLRFYRRGGFRHRANADLPDQFLAAERGPYSQHLRERRQYVIDKIAERLGSPETACIIDVGCGDGVALAELQSAVSARLFGFDHSIVSLLRARQHLDESIILIQGDMRERCFKDEIFDVIISIQTLMYLADDIAALRLLARMLRRDGLLIVGVPHTNSWLSRLRNNILQPYIRFFLDELQIYDEVSLRRKLTAAGLAIGEIHRMGWEFPITFVDRWLHGLAITDAIGNWLFSRIGWLNANSPRLFAVCRKEGSARRS